MSDHHDGLDESGEALPVNPGRRRIALLMGLLLIAGILGSLIWFSVNHTETRQDRGGLFGMVTDPAPCLPS